MTALEELAHFYLEGAVIVWGSDLRYEARDLGITMRGPACGPGAQLADVWTEPVGHRDASGRWFLFDADAGAFILLPGQWQDAIELLWPAGAGDPPSWWEPPTAEDLPGL